jgi:hypothetical protein
MQMAGMNDVKQALLTLSEKAVTKNEKRILASFIRLAHLSSTREA